MLRPEEIAESGAAECQKEDSADPRRLEGHRMNALHRRLIDLSLNHMAFLEEQISTLDGAIVQHIQAQGLEKPYQLSADDSWSEGRGGGESCWRSLDRTCRCLAAPRSYELVGWGGAGEQRECRQEEAGAGTSRQSLGALDVNRSSLVSISQEGFGIQE